MRGHGSFGRKQRAALVALGCIAASISGAVAAEEHSADLDAMILREAKRHGVPEELVRRVVQRESRFNPRARNHKYWGLMQISYPTARSMGFKGTPEELLNPVTNLTYAVPYLANAFIIAGKREDAAVRLYAHGYYEAAKHRGLLGILRTAESTPMAGFEGATPVEVAAAEPAPSYGIFGALVSLGSSASPPPPPVAQPVLVAAAEPVPQAAPQPAGSQPVSPPPAAVANAQSGKGDGDATMVTDKAGRLEPPKRWRHDGGVTVLARGEQGIEHVAAYSGVHAEDSHARGARHSHKTTEFASLDVPNSAQAYAERGAETAPSQAAIEQAVAQPGVVPNQAPTQPAATAPDASAPDATAKHHPARHSRHKAAKTTAAPDKSVADLRPSN